MSYLGVTPPISSALPTVKEIQCNEELETFLKENQVGESVEGNRAREEIVEHLLEIFKQWVTEVGLKRGIAEGDCAGGAGAKLFGFGSQRLGVHSPEADIDILCCAPQFVTRYDFFLSFLDILKGLDCVQDILSLPVAYTPVIKFTFYSHSIDLVFVSLAVPKIAEDINILDMSNLQKLDEAGIRSLNGVRVTEMILRLVPDHHSFCVALLAIKYWATRRGIYSNVLGFLGGVNYAILVAFVCQRYINACPATIVHHFFKIFSQWHWPAPVVLAAVEDEASFSHPDTISMASWNPKLYPSDGHHVMPIITPAFPSMNSAFNVCVPQFRMIQLEIQRSLFLFESLQNASLEEDANMAIDIDNRIVQPEAEEQEAPISAKRQPLQAIMWQKLFASAAPDFFQLFPRYIQVEVISNTAEEFRVWFGWCESRLRHLFVSIEQTQLAFCHPYSNCFHRRVPVSPDTDNDRLSFSSSFFIGLSFPERTRVLDLTEMISSFKFRVCSWVGKTAQMDLKLWPLLTCELPEYVFSESIPVGAPRDAGSTLPETSMQQPVSDLCDTTAALPGTLPPVTPSSKCHRENGRSGGSSSAENPGVSSSSKKIAHSGSTPSMSLLGLGSNVEQEQQRSLGVEDAHMTISTPQRIDKRLFSGHQHEDLTSADPPPGFWPRATHVEGAPPPLPPPVRDQHASPMKSARKGL